MPRITEKRKTERKGRKRERKSPLEGHFSGGSVPAPRGESGALLVESWWNTRHGSEAKNPRISAVNTSRISSGQLVLRGSAPLFDSYCDLYKVVTSDFNSILTDKIRDGGGMGGGKRA